MSAIYIMTLLVLMGTDILTSKSHAGSNKNSDSRDSKGSSKNSDSRDSKGKDETYCKTAIPYKQKVEDTIKYYNGKKQPLPTCKCGSSGTISKIDTLDVSSGKTTSLVTCSGCAGPEIPVQSDAECCNIADIFRPHLDKFCQIVRLRCKNYTVYRCGSSAESTTQARTTLPITQSRTTPLTTQSGTTPLTTQSRTTPPTTKSLPSTTTINDAPTTGTSTSLPTTSVQSAVTTQTITRRITPIFNPNYHTDDYGGTTV